MIQPEAAKMRGALTYASTRDKDPWHEDCRHIACDTAYRWTVGFAVGLHLLAINKTCIHI